MFMIEHILKQPAIWGSGQSVSQGEVLLQCCLSSVSRFLCLLPPCACWACQRRRREICDLNLGLMLFTVEYIQASSHFLLFSVTGSWRAEKHLCPNEFFFFLLCSFLSASDTWPPGICCVFSMQKLPASKQSTWTRMGRAGLKAGHRVNPLVTGSDIQVKWFLWLNRL